MSIVAVQEILAHDGGFDVSESNYQRKYTRKFLVETDTLTTDGTIAIQAHLLIPKVGDIFTRGGEFDTQSLCKEVKITQQDTGFFWDVECSYSTQTLSEEWEENPLLRPVEAELSTEKITRAVDQDIGDNPIVNSADTKFDPPIEITERVLKYTFKKNSIEGLEEHAAFLDRTNSVQYLGKAVGTMLFDEFTSTRVWKGGLFYFEVSYSFLYKLAGWKRKILDAGYYEIDILTGDRVEIKSPATGQPVSEPWPLNGGGVHLDVGDPPVFLEFTVHDETDFNLFNIFP